MQVDSTMRPILIVADLVLDVLEGARLGEPDMIAILDIARATILHPSPKYDVTAIKEAICAPRLTHGTAHVGGGANRSGP